MSLLILLLGIATLLALILWARLNAFLALLIAALITGRASGMEPSALLSSIQSGIGNTLGGLAAVLALGVMLGSMLGESGAARSIAQGLIGLMGEKNAKIALSIASFVVGIAMFYNAGFVVMAPLAFSIARLVQQPLLPLAIAMAAPLSVTHGFLPPHPAATAVAQTFHADLSKTLLMGLLLSIPAIVAGGLIFPGFLKNIHSNPPEGLFAEPEKQQRLPALILSLSIAVMPVALMALSAGVELWYADDEILRQWSKFLGDPTIALLLAVLVALMLLGNTKAQRAVLLDKSGVALGAAASLLLIIAAGGAFKQVLVDSALGKDVAAHLMALPFSPLFVAWATACMLRIAVGSATVAGMTAAGIVAPLMESTGASPELMTLAIGSGSLMCSHVNDTGFWMFKEWFGLSMKDCFLTWTLMETIVGICGLLGVLLLEFIG